MKFKFTKKKVIGAVVVLLMLVFAFWWGGDAPGLRGFNVKSAQSQTKNQEQKVSENKSGKNYDYNNDINTNKKVQESLTNKKSDVSQNDIQVAEKKTTETENKTNDVSQAKKPTEKPGNGQKLTASQKVELAQQITGTNVGSGTKGDKEYSEQQGMNINESTNKDQYMTSPVPEGKPVPVEPQNTKITDEEQTCTLTVRCDTILDNMNWLDKEKIELVPKDGVIFAKKTVTFYKGESVFNVLLREMKKNKIHMEYKDTPIYNSAYLEGIANIYEFDCGELSGWQYRVNGWFPNYGASRYQLKQGDNIEWLYTCDLGADIGGFNKLEEIKQD